MNILTNKPESDLIHNLKWLMFFRVLFTSLLLGSTIILQLGESNSPLERPLMVLYTLTATIFLLSFLYAAVINRIESESAQQGFASIQSSIDTFLVTLIVFVTGGFSSIFSFLYLVVIIYSSILLPFKGTIAIAALCSMQYGLMIGMEYFHILMPFVTEASLTARDYSGVQILYKALITITACFAVATLCRLLSEQERQAKEELASMENRVKRVEKMAAMGEMAAGLAHEIKNPLASIASSIQLLRDDFQDRPDSQRLMEIVLRETGRLNTLVGNFLLFARPPVGKSEKIRLDLVLFDIISLFEKNNSYSHRIGFENKSHSDIWIEMDRGHFHQVVWNLLTNAAEAIGTDDGLIQLQLNPPEGDMACVKVMDNGCDVSDENMKSIFHPFFTTKPKGTGLGLSIVHSILESYGGTLDVESAMGKGSIFILRLRRVQEPT